MEAKATVMSDKQIDDAIKSPLNYKYRNYEQEWRCYENIAQAQAEITGKIMKQEGRREIVEWTAREFGVDWSEEKEQLKEWGIE